MTLVVEDHLFLRGVGGGELAALRSVGDGDEEGELRGDDGCPIERDATLNERADHGEETTSGTCDSRTVGAICGDVTVSVEQVLSRHPHAVKVQPTIVDSIEATFEPVILAADVGQETVGVTDRHVEGVHSVGDALRHQLREDDGGGAVQGGVTEVVLPGGAERGIDHELLGGLVVGRGGADGCDIRSVTGLGHREGAGYLEAHDAGQKPLVVALSAEVQHRCAEEAPLHARLDLERWIGGDNLLEGGDVGPVVVFTAEGGREGFEHRTGVGEEPQLTEHALALVVEVEAVIAMERGVFHEPAGLATRIRPGAKEVLPQQGGIDAAWRRGG